MIWWGKPYWLVVQKIRGSRYGTWDHKNASWLLKITLLESTQSPSPPIHVGQRAGQMMAPSKYGTLLLARSFRTFSFQVKVLPAFNSILKIWLLQTDHLTRQSSTGISNSFRTLLWLPLIVHRSPTWLLMKRETLIASLQPLKEI